MQINTKVFSANAFAARTLNWLQSPFALAARVYVSWQFLKSGWLKVNSWEQTLYLFENEYHTPLLSPHAAAVSGAFGELFFPSLLAVGLMGRLSAIGLFAVNCVAVISYSNVLLAEGSEAALGQHILWGTLLTFLAIYGPGKLSLDQVLTTQPH
jgi:putative oxidoreductase